MFQVGKVLCHKCGGRGHEWTDGTIVNRRTGVEIATTYRQGERCECCGGYGEIGIEFAIERITLVFTALLVLYFAWQFTR